ncbi:hypothetical protein ONE63_001696 [Megalurothrips usitatus]|uniref:Uncharacterized protein n=1 Tax=Megalurothrips usitatus TaxID=439358 RepID=A0AAV7XC91_9NEOP|nr:hypothetical protein ONE63_001696 [Megalurothrips usitatus]
MDPCHVLMCGDGGSFEYRIRVLTRNCGVRIVLNTLAGGELRASVGCLSISGRLLHYNRDDALAGRSIGEDHHGNGAFHRTPRTVPDMTSHGRGTPKLWCKSALSDTPIMFSECSYHQNTKGKSRKTLKVLCPDMVSP